MTSKTFHLHISYSNNLGFILDNVKGIQASEKQFKIFDYIKSLWFLMDFYYYRNTLLCRWSKTKIISIVATGYYGKGYLELLRLKTDKVDAKVQYQSILLNKPKDTYRMSNNCLAKTARHLEMFSICLKDIFFRSPNSVSQKRCLDILKRHFKDISEVSTRQC